MAGSTNRLKVDGLPENITEDQLKLVLRNKRRLGGGPITDVELTRDKGNYSAVVTFEECEAVDLILSRGSTVDIQGVQARVQALFDEDEAKRKKRRPSKTTVADKSMEEEDSSRRFDKSVPERLASDETENKKSSSKPGKKISKAPKSDIQTRKKKQVTVASSDEEDDMPGEAYSETTKTRVTKTKDTKKIKTKAKAVVVQRSDRSEQESSDTDQTEYKAPKEKKKIAKSSKPDSCIGKKEHPSRAKQPRPEASDEEEEFLEKPWETTIKVTVKDISKSKDSYILLFECISQEDPNGESDLDEESMMLDGLNKNIYITFDTKKAAQDACKVQLHQFDTIISKVEMATEADFNTWPNLMSVHGHSFDTREEKRDLEEFTKEKTGLDVDDIIWGDEARSAIIVFNPDTCGDISSATWDCAVPYKDGKHLITAPVFKSYSLKVTGINPDTSDLILQFYLSNKKRSGGGKVKSVQRCNKTEAIVDMEDAEGYDGLLQKKHELEKYHLQVLPVYPCLSVEMYRKCVEPINKQQDIRRPSQTFAGDQRPSPGESRQRHAPWVPSTIQSLQEGLKCKVFHHLYHSANVQNRKKQFFGALKLVRFGCEFVLRHRESLDTVLKPLHCSYETVPKEGYGYMNLKLQWSQKINATMVKDKLWAGIDATKNYLDTFNGMEFEMNESHIYDFQRYCLDMSRQELHGTDVFFDHQFSVAVVISHHEAEWIKNTVNKLYTDFLSGVSCGVNRSASKFEQKPFQLGNQQRPGDTANQTGLFDGFSSPGAQAGQQTQTKTSSFTELHRQENEKQAWRQQKGIESDEEKDITDEYPEMEEEELEEKGLIMFQKMNFQKYLSEKGIDAKVFVNLEKSCAVIRAKEQRDLLRAKVELMRKYTEIKVLDITDLSHEQRELLSSKDTQEKLEKMFRENDFQAHLKCETDSVTLYYLGALNMSKLKEIVMSQVVKKERPIDMDQLLLFESEKGCKFLAGLCDRSDGIKISSIVRLEANKRCLLIVAPSSQQDAINNEVNRFLQENRQHTQDVPFSGGKQEFVRKFLGDKLKEIETALVPLGAKMTQAQDKFVLQGLKDGVETGQRRLRQLSDSISVQEASMKFFGIKEFLLEGEGKSILHSIEHKHSCIIMDKDNVKTDSGKDGKSDVPTKPPTPIARSKIDDESSVWFMQGDLISLNVDAIVSPLDSTLKLSSAFGKALISRGGFRIQSELDVSGADSSAGNVIETSPGKLENIKAIIHVVCPVFDTNSSDSIGALQKAITACLKHAGSQGYRSIAFPALGSGGTFKFPDLAASNAMMKSIKGYVKGGDSGVKQFYLCDRQAKRVKEMIERSEHEFADCEMEELGKLQETAEQGSDSRTSHGSPSKSHPGSSPRSHPSSSSRSSPPKMPSSLKKKIRHIEVKRTLGEITKLRTDVIVITAHKSLDLNRGPMAKAVLRYGGDSIQQELRDNYGGGIQAGEFAKTSGGKLKCTHIFHANLSHWRGDSSEAYMSKLIYNMLKEAESLQASSIAIPALGTGKLKYPADSAARAITDAIRKFAGKNSGSSLKHVELVVFPSDTDVAQAFDVVLSGGAVGGAGSDDDDDDNDSHSGEGASYLKQFSHAYGKAKDWLTGGSTKTEFTYGSVKLKVKRGNIIEENCDAITSSVKDSMDMTSSGAVCKALLDKCGPALQLECNDNADDMDQSGIVMTSAPNLSCKNIFHVSMDKFKDKWDTCIVEVLTEAERQGHKSVALPAFGTGSKRANIQRLKKMIFKGVKDFGERGRHSLTDVRLVIYTKDLYDEFVGKTHVPKQREHSPPPLQTKVSDHVDLKIYYTNAHSVHSAIKELNQALTGAFKEEKEENEKSLDKRQARQLQEVGLQNCVQVTVSFSEGIVIMRGFNQRGFVPVFKKLKELSLAAVKEHHEALQKSVKLAFQWQYDQDKKWRDFEPVHNMELEREYKNKSKTYDIVDSRQRSYRIDFTNLKEYALDPKGRTHGDGIPIRRYDRTRGGEPLPTRWEHMPAKQNLLVVPVKAGSQEYKSVEQNFVAGGAGVPVKKIERIQNKVLYQQYAVKKRELDSRNPNNGQNEKRLFHGTSADTVPLINDNGFNRSHCGKNATAYGEGVYFAVSSSLSVGYASQDMSGNRYMYQARVLVGMTTPSRSGMKYLPMRTGNTPYDSGTDGANRMYIIFHDCQAYPEYLITF